MAAQRQARLIPRLRLRPRETSSDVTHLFVVADNQTVVYGSANPTPTFRIYGDIAGSLNTLQVTCTYPGLPRNTGSYAITCTGPLTKSATDGVTYNARYLSYTPGALTITPRPITVKPTMKAILEHLSL